MEKANNLAIEDIVPGMSFSFDVVVDEMTVDSFAGISGDRNPLHMDEEYAKVQGYAGRVVHGALLAMYFSRLVGMYCPGRYSLLQTMNLKFPRPSHVGERLTVSGTVVQVSRTNNVVVLQARIYGENMEDVRASGKIQAGFLAGKTAVTGDC